VSDVDDARGNPGFQQKSRPNVVAVAGVSDAGFEHDGISTHQCRNIFQVGILPLGKIPGGDDRCDAIGTRMAMLNLFGSSEGTVWPKRRRASDAP